MSTDKTLADVQPGRRVRLPQARQFDSEFLWWLMDAASTLSEGGNESHAEHLRALHAALSAQPSPGGQDVLFIEELAELRRLVPSVNQKHALDAAIAALAARQPVASNQVVEDLEQLAVDTQPVGEPVVVEVPQGAIINGAAFADRLEHDYQFECPAGPLANCTDYVEFRRCFDFLAQWASSLPPLYAAPPAQAVGSDAVRERDLLGAAIIDAAVKSGIYRDGVPMSGPQLLMACDDMAECIKSAQAVDLGQFRRPIEEWRSDMEKWAKEHGDPRGAFASDLAEADRLLALIDSHSGVSRD